MVRKRLFSFFSLILAIIVLLMHNACSAEKFVGDGEYMLDKVEIRTDDKTINPTELAHYVRQKSNSKWFSFFKIPLGTYALAGSDTTKWLNKTLRKVGEKPVIYDTLQARLSCEDLKKALQNMGYMNATVSLNTSTKGKKLKAIYQLHPGVPFIITQMNYEIEDSVIANILRPNLLWKEGSEIKMPFTVAALDNERKRITALLNDSGYYRFNKEYITFTADSVQGEKNIGLTMHIAKYRPNKNATPQLHPRYIIGKVNIDTGDECGVVNLRKDVLNDNIWLEEGKYFSATDLQKTYNNFARLGAVKYTNIDFKERQSFGLPISVNANHPPTPKPYYLDADIKISGNAPHAVLIRPEGTNTAGDLGVAAVLGYENRNLFRGSEQLNIEFRGAFETIKGLEGYDRSNYEEYSIQSSIEFPRMLAPFTTKAFRRRSSAVTEFSVSWNLQNRPEFHRRIFSSAWKYRWGNPRHHLKYEFDVLDLSYVYMPWISQTFKRDYLDDVSNRNAILRYNYEDLLIMRMALGINYTHNDVALRAQIESAGNLLSALNGVMNFKQNADGQRMLFNTAYAQYVKLDADYTKLFRFDSRNALAVHAEVGIAIPYGNSSMLPFEKRYVAGGANSVRGWGVRELGPGSFRGRDGRIDFINQTGDIKLDLNLEYRTNLFWKFTGAAFIDAGNIWTLHNYADQPGGQFKFTEFYKQLAAAYGVGLRLNFDYFILRLDAGMKAINPVYNTRREHFPILRPNFGRDFKLHFAVGLPF